MNYDLVFGIILASSAYIALCVMIFYNINIIEKIHKKNISHVREIKHKLNKKKQ
jgi:hypothetical protein